MNCGDYVEVLPGVHDDGIPEGRRDGLIVEIVGTRRDQAIVMFSNQNFLKFVMFIKKVREYARGKKK